MLLSLYSLALTVYENNSNSGQKASSKGISMNFQILTMGVAVEVLLSRSFKIRKWLIIMCCLKRKELTQFCLLISFKHLFDFLFIIVALLG